MSDCTPNYKDADWAFYRFEPSLEVNVIFTVLFAISTALHALQMFRTKTWYLTALLIGGFCEVIGYIGRIMGALEDAGCWKMGPYIMQNLLILLAPAFMAASIYMILGRIIMLCEAEHHSLIRLKWLTKIFVTGDVLSLLMQASGGGMMAISSMNHIGEKVVVGGLFVQLLFFSCFIAVAGVLHVRLTRAPTTRSSDPDVRWAYYLITLYVAGVLILIRSVFRVAEFIQGNKGTLMSKEIYVFIFDGLLMLIVLAWLNWFHPSEIGLLLRGDLPIKNGFELIKLKRGSRARASTMESLHSSGGGKA